MPRTKHKKIKLKNQNIHLVSSESVTVGAAPARQRDRGVHQRKSCSTPLVVRSPVSPALSRMASPTDGGIPTPPQLLLSSSGEKRAADVEQESLENSAAVTVPSPDARQWHTCRHKQPVKKAKLNKTTPPPPRYLMVQTITHKKKGGYTLLSYYHRMLIVEQRYDFRCFLRKAHC